MTLRNEVAGDALTAADDERDWREHWEAQRDIDLGHPEGWVSDAEQIAHYARDRAAVEEQSHRDHLREVAERALAHQGWRSMYHGEAEQVVRSAADKAMPA